jgi:hypothetical protein
MNTTHDDNAATWRDLADQLTPEQIAELEYCEREGVPPGIADAGHQLNHARKLAELNLARAMLADVPPPPDAIGEIDEWMDWDADLYQRTFESWKHPACEVSVLGQQFSDGRVERYILCDADTNELSAERAREIGAALMAAADEIDGWAR